MKLALNRPMKLALGIAGGLAALIVVALIGINLLISADAVRDRVAARVKEQTGRELSVKGSTSLMLLPNPHIVITDMGMQVVVHASAERDNLQECPPILWACRVRLAKATRRCGARWKGLKGRLYTLVTGKVIIRVGNLARTRTLLNLVEAAVDT